VSRAACACRVLGGLEVEPAALALVDEYDEMLANVKGQGDPLGLVEARGETYADFVTAITSTPSRGLIETELDERSGLRFWKTEPEASRAPSGSSGSRARGITSAGRASTARPTSCRASSRCAGRRMPRRRKPQRRPSCNARIAAGCTGR
jgi:phage terminase large subunit GpA-like protein